MSLKNSFFRSAECLHFVQQSLVLDPSQRPSASHLLNASFFTHDNFHVIFPIQIKAKSQAEFGGNHLMSSLTSNKESNSRRALAEKKPNLDNAALSKKVCNLERKLLHVCAKGFFTSEANRNRKCCIFFPLRDPPLIFFSCQSTVNQDRGSPKLTSVDCDRPY